MRRRRFGGLILGALAAGCGRRGLPAAAAIAQPGGTPSATEAGQAPEGPHPLEGFCEGVPAVAEQEFEARRSVIAAGLVREGIDALVLEPGANMQYLAGVRWGRSERPFLAVLRADASVSWVAPSFEARSAKEQLGEGAVLETWDEDGDPFALAVAAAGGPKAAVAVDPDARGFIFEGVRSGAPAARLSATAIVDARLRKTAAELDRLRRANEATKAAIAWAAKGLQPGMTQSAFAAELTAAQQAAGLRGVWCLALFGPAASFPHGTAEDRALREDDVVLVDTGGSLHGYRSDVSRTWMRGTVGAGVQRAWRAVAEAQAAALKEIRVGALCEHPDAAARAAVEAAGFRPGYGHFTHRLGHGIGLEVHEPPYLRPGNARVLAAGMTMSNEPGIYEPGAYGIRIEDIVAVTDAGPVVLGPPVGPLEDPLAGHLPRGALTIRATARQRLDRRR